MSIYKNAVKKPITTLMVFTAVIVFGLYSLMQVPVDLYPEIEPPFVSIMTTYPGANASEIEANVTKLIEDGMNSVDKLKEITSVSYDNLSVISLEFEWESNLDEVMNDVRNVMDRLFNYLPEGCDRPAIFKFSTAMMPILFYAVTASVSYPGIEKILEEKIVNPLNRIDGIGSVATIGVPRRKVYVNLDARQLDAYNITLEQIGHIIGAENLNMPAGHVKMGQVDYQLKVQGELGESADLEKLIVGNFNGKPVYLGDIAEVSDTLKDKTMDEKINGQTGLRLFIMKQSGANTIFIARKAQKMMEELVKTLPSDIKIEPIMDTSEFIKGAIRNLSQTLLWALLFVIMVVLFFLGRWRATFIIVLTIPISLIVSFIYLYVTGNTINVISLSSLSIAIGMVVDDAIVVLENITKHIERGSSPREAAIYATNEVWLAVIVTTMVIVAVFFPLTLVGGMTGVMFKQLGWIVTITVCTSTLVAITLTPMLTSKLMRLKKRKTNDKTGFYERSVGRLLGQVDQFYEKSIRWSLLHKKLVGLMAIAVFVASIFIAARHIKTDFMPQTDESRLMVAIELQTGLRVEESAKVARHIEDMLQKRYPEITVMAVSAGADDEGSFTSLFTTTGSNRINVMMRLKPLDERSRSVFEIADDLRQQLNGMAEILNYNVTTSGGIGGGGSDNTVNIELFGFDFNTTNQLAEEVKNRLSALTGARDIQVSRERDKPELQIILDREKLAQSGLNSTQVSVAIRNRVNGLIASRFREAGNEYDIVVRFKENYRNSITDLEQITLMAPGGAKIKLKELGEVKEYWSPPNIEHKRRQRIVRVSVKPMGISLGELAGEIKTALSDLPIPPDVMINVGGAYEDQMEGFKDILLLLLLSLILVYLVMASQFESFAMPFIIMFSIPFAFTGVVLGLFVTGTTLSLIAALGAVLLIGIVVKNGIVLVDYINLMRNRGMELNEAIAVSGHSRLRPVLMTAFTTILGMMPLALSQGEGSEIWKPMGIAVIGGLVFSTIITLIIVPVAYAIFIRHNGRSRKRLKDLS